ncbi:MAG: hypothetical protein AAF721_03720 [Myxococcota bacterium]
MRASWWPCGVLGLGLLACKIPSTLGLVCQSDVHCDDGQYCAVDETCQAGPAPSATGAESTGSVVDPTSGGAAATTAAVDTSGSTSEGGSSSETTAPGTSTGPTCGVEFGTCDHLDVLFLYDNSGSMNDDLAAIFLAFIDEVQGLHALLTEGLCTFQIGVTTTEPDLDFQPESCRTRGALNRSSALLDGQPCSGDPDHPPWLNENDPATGLTCYLTAGMSNEPDEHQLETVLTAIGPELTGPGGCNEGFIREDAGLIVVIITDEDDDDDSASAQEPGRTGSPGDPTTWYEDLIALKRPENLGVIIVAGDAAKGCDWQPSPGNSDGTGAERPVRLTQLVELFQKNGYADHVEQLDLCTSPNGLLAQINTFDSFIRNVCEDAVFE